MPQDRIKELRRVPASSITANVKNWRTHPIDQRNALQSVLEDIGYAGALIARENDAGELILIDGHLRQEITGDEIVPVLVLDVTEDEADKLLATFDPLTEMAEFDAQQFKSLLDGLSTDNEQMAELFQKLSFDADRALLGFREQDEINPNESWQGMPEFEAEDLLPWRSIKVNFKCQEDLDAFAKLIDQKLTDKTRYVWFPRVEPEQYKDKRYVDEEPKQ